MNTLFAELQQKGAKRAEDTVPWQQYTLYRTLRCNGERL